MPFQIRNKPIVDAVINVIETNADDKTKATIADVKAKVSSGAFLVVLVGQIPNIIAGNWSAVESAFLALILP